MIEKDETDEKEAIYEEESARSERRDADDSLAKEYEENMKKNMTKSR